MNMDITNKDSSDSAGFNMVYDEKGIVGISDSYI